MRAICVVREEQLLEQTVSVCRVLPQIQDVQGFVSAQEALAWVQSHPLDLALLDLEAADMAGLTLARQIRENRPDAAILFLSDSALVPTEIFAVRPAGCLLKPVNRESLAAEVSYIFELHQRNATLHISVQTFGSFVVEVEGTSVAFRRSKAKELLAYLVDRQGGSVSRAQIFAALWEDENYDRARQKQLDVIVRSLCDTLEEYGIGEILERKRGYMRIRPEAMDCDLFRFLKGDPEAVNSYRGEYMSSYSWASLTEAFMTERRERI